MSRKQNKPKKKKEKIVYIDDGSTVADMSGTRRRPMAPMLPGGDGRREPRSRAGKILHTYFSAVRSMIGPMLIVLGGVSVIFFLIWVILGFFA
jgi:hypothetical protein